MVVDQLDLFSSSASTSQVPAGVLHLHSGAVRPASVAGCEAPSEPGTHRLAVRTHGFLLLQETHSGLG